MIPALDGLAGTSVFDMSDMKSSAGGLRSSVSGVTNGLRGLGLINEQTAGYLTIASGGLQIATGVLGITSVLRARVSAKTTIETARASALVAANSWNPVGWGTITLAAGCATVASIGIYAAMTTIKADLSTPVGRQQAIDGVTGAMA